MGLLDNLFLGQTNDPADDQWKRAALEELLARSAAAGGLSNDPAEGSRHGAVSFVPSRSRGDVPRPVLIDEPSPMDVTVPPAPAPFVPAMGSGPIDDAASPWKPSTSAPMGERNVPDRPAPGAPYSGPETLTGWSPAVSTPTPSSAPSAGPTTTPGTMGGGTGAASRTPTAWDRFGAFVNSDSLLGGVHAAGDLDRQFSERNATAEAIAAKLGDPAIARAVIADPASFRAILPTLFAPKANWEKIEADDGTGRKRFVYVDKNNPRNVIDLGLRGASPATEAFATTQAKNQSEQYDTIIKAARSAREQINSLGAVESALSTYNDGSTFGTGRAAPAEMAIRGYLKSVGVGDADTLAAGELITAFQNRMSLIMRNPDSGMGMPGAVSDRDLAFLKDAQAGIDKSPEGNRKLIEIMRKLETRKIELAQFAEQYVKQRGSLEGFEQAVKQWADQRPLFAGAAGGAPAVGAVVRGYRFKGGDPSSRDSWERAS